MSFVFLIAGFGLLIVGADVFVAGASSLAKKFGIPSIIIGLTVVAFGTSAPELAVSITAGLNGSNEISLGNVVGSNVFNLLMVIGCSALVTNLTVDKSLIKRDWSASIFGTILVFLFIIFDGIITQLDAFCLLVCFAVVLYLQLKEAKNSISTEENLETTDNSLKIWASIIIGALCIVGGGQISVDSASEIARMFGLSETLIGLTVIALGTSLPELVTSVVATKRGERDIAIGNVIGSNLFNIFLVLGVSCAIKPIPVQPTAYFDIVFLLIISVWTIILAKMEKITRNWGFAMICTYLAYTTYIIIR